MYQGILGKPSVPLWGGIRVGASLEDVKGGRMDLTPLKSFKFLFQKEDCFVLAVAPLLGFLARLTFTF